MVLAQVVLEILRKNCRGAIMAPPILNRVKMIKYGTLIETRGYDKRILGETANSFKGLIFAKFRNFDVD